MKRKNFCNLKVKLFFPPTLFTITLGYLHGRKGYIVENDNGELTSAYILRYQYKFQQEGTVVYQRLGVANESKRRGLEQCDEELTKQYEMLSKIEKNSHNDIPDDAMKRSLKRKDGKKVGEINDAIALLENNRIRLLHEIQHNEYSAKEMMLNLQYQVEGHLTRYLQGASKFLENTKGKSLINGKLKALEKYEATFDKLEEIPRNQTVWD